MGLATNKQLLENAQKNKIAIGAFNFQNLESVKSIINAANKEKSSVILAASPGTIDYAGLEYVSVLARTAAKHAIKPVSIHLDHGDSLQRVKSCIKQGFTSVMIDASMYDFDKNAHITKQAVKYAHKHHVSVEAELGRLKGIEDYVSVKDREAFLTNPNEAKEFVEKTNIDVLAISIGTSHGAYKFKGKPMLDFARLKKIRSFVKIPLVLHGASSVYHDLVAKSNKFGARIIHAKGVPDNQVRKAIQLGISKVNVDTDLRLAFISSIRETLAKNPTLIDRRKLLGPAEEAVEHIIRKKIRLFNNK